MSWLKLIKPAQVHLLKRRWLLVVVLASGAGLGWFLNQPAGSAPRYETAAVSRGELLQIVAASGQLNPVNQVEVGSQISGIIQKLFVDFNSTIKEGQVIAQIDPATYQANVVQAEGNLANAKAALELAQLNAERAKALYADKLTPKAEYDKSLADLHQAEAAVKINEGALKKAQVDLARCTICAPIDGIVISRNVNVGQTVAASLSAPTLFLIANDLTKMQIEADVAEADIGQVQVGQKVDFTVDAYPAQTFHGAVRQVRNAPKLDQNVVTYATIIEVSNPELKLKPGMTANVSLIVARRDDALKIPNAALRFHPPKSVEVKKADSEASAKGARKFEVATRKKDKRKAERTVYVLAARDRALDSDPSGAPRPVQIRTGISDGSFTEVLEGLKEGDAVITDMTGAKSSGLKFITLLTGSR